MSYQFTGASSHNIAYSFATNSETKMTLSFWARWTGGWASVIGSILDANYGWGVGNTNDWGKVDIRTQNYNGKSFLTTGSTANADTVWHHYYIVYDGTLSEASRIRLWIDGVEITAWDTQTAGAAIAAAATMYIGAGVGSTGNNYFNGYLAEVAIWLGEAITTGSVIANLAAGYIASIANPTGLDFSVRLASNGDVNSSVGSYNGTVTGATYSSSHPTMITTSGSSRLIAEHINYGSF